MVNYSPEIPEFPTVNPFLPCYGKFDLTTYIQGASDYEIMANLVQLYNTMAKGYNDVQKLSTDTVTAYNQLQDFVNNTLGNQANIINAKLNEMLNNGTLQTLVNTTGLGGNNVNPKIAITPLHSERYVLDTLKNVISGVIIYVHFVFNKETKQFELDEDTPKTLNDYIASCISKGIHVYGLKFHDAENHVDLSNTYGTETIFNAYKNAVLSIMENAPVLGEYVWIYNEKENIRNSTYAQYIIALIHAIKERWNTLKVSSPYAYPSAYFDCDDKIKNAFDCQSFNVYPIPPIINAKYSANIENTKNLYNYYYDIIANHNFELVVTEFGNCASWEGYKSPANYIPGDEPRALACGFFGLLNSRFSTASLVAPWWTEEYNKYGQNMLASAMKGVNVYYGDN